MYNCNCLDLSAFEFFTVYIKLPEMELLASKDFTPSKKLPPVGLDMMITGSRDYCWFKGPMEFSLNGAELSLNSANLINHWSIKWNQFKVFVSHMCLAGAVVASWSLMQEVAGSNAFTVMTNIFVAEFSEDIQEKLHCLTKWASLTCSCKCKTFKSLYSHALLIIGESCKPRDFRV